MIRLMKAEWFRIRHSGSQWLILWSVLLMSAAIVLFVNEEMTVSLDSFLEAALSMTSAAAVAVTSVIVYAFHLRLGQYELAGGYLPHEIVLSKLLLGAFILNVFYCLPVLVLLAVLGSVPAGTLFLIWLCIMRIYVFIMSFGIAFKHVAVSVFSLMLLAFETMPFVFFGYATGTDVSPAVSMLVSTQLYALGSAELNASMLEAIPNEHIAVKIIISSVVVAALMYWLAYVSTKKRWVTEQSYK